MRRRENCGSQFGGVCVPKTSRTMYIYRVHFLTEQRVPCIGRNVGFS